MGIAPFRWRISGAAINWIGSRRICFVCSATHQIRREYDVNQLNASLNFSSRKGLSKTEVIFEFAAQCLVFHFADIEIYLTFSHILFLN